MRRLCFAEREWIAMVANGAFSFQYDGEKLTTARGVTFCASTFNAMIARGWVEPIQ